MKKEMLKEQLSAMLDSELEAGEMAHVFSALNQPDIYRIAEIYFCISDVLREGEAFQEPSRSLHRIVRERLQSETYISVDLDDSDLAEEKKEGDGRYLFA